MIRRRVADFLASHGIAEPVSGDAVLVAAELASNAIEHGSREGDSVEIDCEVIGGRLRIRVLDAARGSAPVRLGADAQRVRGRGLAIVERLTLGWSERIRDGRREVSAELPIA